MKAQLRISRLFFLVFSLFCASTVEAQGQVSDFRRSPLDFDLTKAFQLLNARPYITTSPYFENPNGYDIDVGQSHAGVIWGNYSVSFSASSSLILTNIASDHTRRAGDTFISVVNLQWDEEKGKYAGYGTYRGRGNLKCPLDVFPAWIEIDIWKDHPFQGAWHSLTVHYTTSYVNSDTCQVVRREKARAQASRTFTTIETIRAIEQANEIFDRHVVDARAWLNSQMALAKAKEKNEVDQVLEQIQDALNRVDDIEVLIDDTEWALKHGGRVQDINTGEWHDFKKPEALERVPSFLFQSTARGLEEALSIQKDVQSIRKMRLEEGSSS